MRLIHVLAMTLLLAVAWGAGPVSPLQANLAVLQQQVRSREEAFAKTMADRDLAAFTAFLSSEAVFVGPNGVARGPKDISATWKRYFDGSQAPFSWRPETVEVLDSGMLALSSGPVFDPQGKRVGTFNSIWRRDADGAWRIVFDNGCP